MAEDQDKVVHDFLVRRAKEGAYSLARLKALSKLAKLHREEFLNLVHEERDLILPKFLERAENQIKNLTPESKDSIIRMLQWKTERDQAKRKIKRGHNLVEVYQELTKNQ